MAKTQHVGGYLGILFQWNPQMGIYICCLLLKSGQNIKIYSIRSSDLCVLSRFGNLTVCFLVQIWFPVHRLIENGAPLHCEQNHSPRKNAKKEKAGWNASSRRKVTRYDFNMWIAAHMFSLSWKAFIVLHSHGKWQKQFSLVESKKKKEQRESEEKTSNPASSLTSLSWPITAWSGCERWSGLEKVTARLKLSQSHQFISARVILLLSGRTEWMKCGQATNQQTQRSVNELLMYVPHTQSLIPILLSPEYFYFPSKCSLMPSSSAFIWNPWTRGTLRCTLMIEA